MLCVSFFFLGVEHGILLSAILDGCRPSRKCPFSAALKIVDGRWTKAGRRDGYRFSQPTSQPAFHPMAAPAHLHAAVRVWARRSTCPRLPSLRNLPWLSKGSTGTKTPGCSCQTERRVEVPIIANMIVHPMTSQPAQV